MKVINTAIADVKIIEPSVYTDPRGFFMESFNAQIWNKEAGIAEPFVQDNHSKSERNVLRGLHYQIIKPQGKLVRAVRGEIFDVAVDLRRSSPDFGKWVGAVLSADNHHQLWVPVGFAHGFLVLSDEAEVLYKSSNFYCPEGERGLAWNDPDVGVEWPMDGGTPLLSEKDQRAASFAEADCFD